MHPWQSHMQCLTNNSCKEGEAHDSSLQGHNSLVQPSRGQAACCSIWGRHCPRLQRCCLHLEASRESLRATVGAGGLCHCWTQEQEAVAAE